MSTLKAALRAPLLTTILTIVASLPASAADGVIEINQARAAAGAVNGDLGLDPPGFPVVITEPGSYRLTGSLDLTVEEFAVSGIEIAVDAVTVDLGGFEIHGAAFCSGGGSELDCGTTFGVGGVLATQSARFAEVRNGTVRGIQGSGVWLGSFSRVEDITARENAGSGIWVLDGSVVTDCVATRNGQEGIRAGNVVVRESASNENGSNGILAGANSVVVRNQLRFNAVNGVASGGVISDNGTASNDVDGIHVVSSSGTVVAGNTVVANGDDGIDSVDAFSALLDSNTVYFNRFGIYSSNDHFLVHNVAAASIIIDATGITQVLACNELGDLQPTCPP